MVLALAGGAAAADVPPAPVAAARDAAARRDAATILRLTLDYLGSLQSLHADGESVGSPGTRTRFSMRLARPDLYRLTWTHGEGGDGQHAVWNAGDGSYEYSSFRKAYVRVEDSQSALARTAGVSEGLTRGIPLAFLRRESWFATLRNPTLDGSEDVEGEPCWVISGPTRETERRTLWISQHRLVIRQHRWSYTLPHEQAEELGRATDAALERMKDLGITEKQKAEIGLMAELGKIGARYGVREGHRTELYRNIRTSEAFDHADFVVDVPEGTTLKSSFEEFLLPRESDPEPTGDEHRARAADGWRDADAILRSMFDRYKGLDALATKGEVVSETSMFGTRTVQTTSFTAAAARPGRYRVTWSTASQVEQGASSARGAGASLEGAVWNAGSGAHIYLSRPPGYASAKSDEVAIAMATGVSQRTALIPGLLLGGDHVLTTIKQPTYEGEERVEGEACYVITGPSIASERHVLWISKRHLVLRRHRWSYTPPADGPDPFKQLDDTSFGEALAQMGAADTPEMRRKMGMLAEMAKAFAKHRAIRGHVTETYRKVRLNPKGTEFEFVPPAGTPRKGSLLDQTAGAPR